MGDIAGQAATPDGPSRWALPDDASTVIAYLTDPGRLPLGTATIVDIRNPWSAEGMIQLPVRGGTYRISVTKLTDATPAADGQDGRDG